MVIKRVPVGLTASQLRKLDQIAAKLGLDRTNTIRYLISQAADKLLSK